MPGNKFKQRHPRNKHTKFQLVFDEENRRDFLTGFQKRKKERQRVARQQQELLYKEEKQKLRQQKRKSQQESWKELHFPDDNDKQIAEPQPIIYDHPQHTVTVESVGGEVTVESMDLQEAHGGIGENRVEYDEDSDDDRPGVESRLKMLDSEDDEERENETGEGKLPNKSKQKGGDLRKLQKLQSKLIKKKPGRASGRPQRNGGVTRHKKGSKKGGHGGHRAGQRGSQRKGSGGKKH